MTEFTSSPWGDAYSTRRQELLGLSTLIQKATAKLRASMGPCSKRIFDTGDDAQKGLVDGLHALSTLNFRGLTVPILDAMHPFVLTSMKLRGFEKNALAWQEFANKLRVMEFVLDVESKLGSLASKPIHFLVDKCFSLQDFEALWVLEGTGRAIIKNPSFRNFDGDKGFKGLLSDPKTMMLPENSLAMLNAGIGLAFAESMFERMRGVQSGLGNQIESFIFECESSGTPGYVGCAIESLGLVSWVSNNNSVKMIDDVIQNSLGEEVLSYFWHGVGRGYYFAGYSCDCHKGISLPEILRFAGHDTGKRNLVAGLAWAMTLVNMKTPRVIERTFRSNEFRFAGIDPAAFSHGVVSSMAVRRNATPNAYFVGEFCKHRPTSGNKELERLWDRLITRNCLATSRHVFTGTETKVERLFRY